MPGPPLTTFPWFYDFVSPRRKSRGLRFKKLRLCQLMLSESKRRDIKDAENTPPPAAGRRQESAVGRRIGMGEHFAVLSGRKMVAGAE